MERRAEPWSPFSSSFEHFLQEPAEGQNPEHLHHLSTGLLCPGHLRGSRPSWSPPRSSPLLITVGPCRLSRDRAVLLQLRYGVSRYGQYLTLEYSKRYMLFGSGVESGSS